MWNPFKTLFSSSPKGEKAKKEMASDELALKEGRRILNEYIDQLAEDFGKIHQPQFMAGDKVQVNAFGIGKPSSVAWEGGASMLMGCLDAPLSESIQAEITGCRVHTGYASEVVDWFFGEKWESIIKWVLADEKTDLILAFDNKLESIAANRKSLTPSKCLYLEYFFKTGSKAKPKFRPQWGLSENAFHLLDSKEAKLTRKLHKQHAKLSEARAEIEKIDATIKKLQNY